MKPRQSVVLAVSIGLIAFLTPILISLRLAWVFSVSSEKSEGIRYATEVLRRGEETAAQFRTAIDLLNSDRFEPCSPQEIDLMRQIDMGSSNIQMVGRISGNTLQCTSLGTTTPIDIGPPTIVTDRGVRERMDVKFGSKQLDTLDIADTEGIAIVVDSALLVDMDTGRDGVALAMTVPSSSGKGRLIASKGALHPAWLKPIGPGQSASLVDGSYVVSQVRSQNFDLAAVAAIPISVAYRQVKVFAVIFIPIGSICGIVLALSVAYIGRLRFSPQGLLRTAARNQDFYVEYQPIVNLATRKIIGAEALVRWKRGDAIISPASFIPLAEEIGIITLITDNVIYMVSRDLPTFLNIDPEFYVSVNVTASDLKSAGIIDRLNDLLHVSGASPRNLVVEATEHGLIKGPGFQAISQLREMGFRVAIDDFGTGYSNLSTLQKLELDLLKIDKAFVDTIGDD